MSLNVRSGRPFLLASSWKTGIFSMQPTVFSCDDDLDRRREELVAAGVIAVRVGVDDVGDRLVGDGLDLIEDRLAVVGEFLVSTITTPLCAT